MARVLRLPIRGGSVEPATYEDHEVAHMRALLRRFEAGDADAENEALVLHELKVLLGASMERPDTPEPEVFQTSFLEPDTGQFKIPERARLEAAGLPDPEANRIGKFSDPEASGAPVTQRKAAILVYPRSGTYRIGVLRAIAKADAHGATDEELYQATGWDENTVRPRRNELMNDGWVEDSGRTRRTPSGKDAVVWVLTEQGHKQWSWEEAP